MHETETQFHRHDKRNGVVKLVGMVENKKSAYDSVKKSKVRCLFFVENHNLIHQFM